MSKPAYKTVKIWDRTHKNLKLISAYQGTSLVECLDEWADAQARFLGLNTGDSEKEETEEKMDAVASTPIPDTSDQGRFGFR